MYTIGSAKQSNDFNIITKYLLNHIKATYKYGADVGSAIKNKQPLDFNKVRPTMAVQDPTITDESQIKAIETENRLLYKAEVNAFIKRKEYYKSNIDNAYAFLFARCNKAMQNKIQARKDFDTIKGDPIKLIKAIEEHAIALQDNKYKWSIIHDVSQKLENIKQRDD